MVIGNCESVSSCPSHTTINDLRFYDRALSESEIAALRSAAFD